MRQLTEQEQAKLKALTSYSVTLTLIEPTRTGLEKSIMDATGPVRQYLLEQGLHNFQDQEQGQEHKVMLPAELLLATETKSSSASLYRPTTKQGDPRIWFSGLKEIASPNDILALLAFDQKIYVFSLTSLPIESLLASSTENPLKELAEAVRGKEGAIALELLGLLRQIAARGPARALLNADTAVGRTLESLLGLPINSSRNPDYKGIELKSYRDKRNNRKSLFAQVPDWQVSKFKSMEEILSAFGYESEGRFHLHCTLSALQPNPQGLSLRVDRDASLLYERSTKPDVGDFAAWKLSHLQDRLKHKHAETFWVAATNTFEDGHEYFQYTRAQHTRKPIVSQFDLLVDQGAITLDHMMTRTASGKADEKGPQFKLKPNCLGLLFPPSSTYDLL